MCIQHYEEIQHTQYHHMTHLKRPNYHQMTLFPLSLPRSPPSHTFLRTLPKSRRGRGCCHGVAKRRADATRAGGASGRCRLSLALPGLAVSVALGTHAVRCWVPEKPAAVSTERWVTGGRRYGPLIHRFWWYGRQSLKNNLAVSAPFLGQTVVFSGRFTTQEGYFYTVNASLYATKSRSPTAVSSLSSR